MTSARQTRTTRQVVAIRQVMADLDSFRTAQALYAELQHRGVSIALATLYRQVKHLADSGQADVVLRSDGEATYRLCGEASAKEPEHHHHRVCRRCGRTVNIENRTVERWAARIAAQAGYSDVAHTVELFGLCGRHPAA